jgi:hypothetical protein
VSASDEPLVLDSFTAPKDVLDEFSAMADEKGIGPFRETAKKESEDLEAFLAVTRTFTRRISGWI